MTVTLPVIRPFDEFEADTMAQLVPRFRSKFGMLRWSELDDPGPEMEWLVDDLLTMGDKSIIAGPSMSGKSFFAIKVAGSIAQGVPMFGHPVKKGLVIYQAGEGALGIKKRLRAYRQYNNIPNDVDLPFVLLQSRVDLYAEDGDTAALIAEIQAIRTMYSDPLRIIFIDTLSKAQGLADENNGRDMGIVMNNIDLIREQTGVHVCLVHHLNADGTKLRGHTSVFANIDQVLAVTCDKETKVRTMRTAKVKDGSDDVSVKFTLAEIVLGTDKAGKQVTSCVTMLEDEKKDMKNEGGEKPFRANAGDTSFLHALIRALRENGESPPENINAPPGVVRVVDYTHVKACYKRQNVREDVDTSKEQNRISQGLKRARENMVKFGVVAFDRPEDSHAGWIWLTGRPVWGMKETYPKQKAKVRNVPSNEGSAPTADEDIPFT